MDACVRTFLASGEEFGIHRGAFRACHLKHLLHQRGCFSVLKA